MSFDLTEPSLPHELKAEGGLLRRLFKRPPVAAPQPSQAPAPAATRADIDLEEIKRKLGFDEEQSPATQTPLPPPPVDAVVASAAEDIPEPTTERAKVNVTDWAAETSTDAHVEVTHEFVQTPPEPEDDSPLASKEHMHKPAPREGVPATELPNLELPKPEEKTEQQPEPESVTPLDWTTAVEEDKSIHHEYIEKQLAPIDREQAKIVAIIERIEQPKNKVPEWHLQEKEVPPERFFVLRNGHTIKSLRELIDILEYIDDATFNHHVTERRNDFANWVRDVISEPKLAQDIGAASDRDSIIDVLRAYENAAHETVKKATKERQQAIEKFSDADSKLSELKDMLAMKSKELSGERKRTAKLVKGKLDQEIRRRLEKEKESLLQARSDLHLARQEYQTKSKQVSDLQRQMGDREKAVMLAEQRAAAALSDAKDARAKFLEEKKTAEQLMRDAAVLQKQYDEMKALEQKNEEALEQVRKKESEFKRREDAIKAREAKISSDITHIQEEKEKLASLETALGKRDTDTKAAEAQAKKMIEEGEARSKAAVVAEREMSAKLRVDITKLEKLRGEVDKMLTKVAGEKKNVQSAVEMRRQIEAAVTRTKQDIVEEHARLRDESYKSFIEREIATTGVGQPAAPQRDDSLRAGKDFPIYAKIEACRSAIERKDLAKARELYMQLRDEYPQATEDTAERSALYNSIRELYDDIHLMLLQ